MRFRLPETQAPGRSDWLGLRPRGAVRRRGPVAPQELPLRPADAEAYVHMRYARTLPLRARGDLSASRRRATLAMVAPELDGLVIEPTRPLSMLRILNRAGFIPARDSDLTLLATALYELAVRQNWCVFEQHAELSHDDELATAVRWGHKDLCIAPAKGAVLLRVRVAGDGMQLAVYSKEPLSAAA